MWATLIPIIAQEGIPMAEALWKLWAAGNEPTQADFDNLRVLGRQTALDHVKAQLIAKGIALDSPQAFALIALIS